MAKMRYMLPFLLLTGLGYYVLPLVIADTGSGMIVLLVVLPIFCMGSSILYGRSAKVRSKKKGGMAFTTPISENEYLAYFFLYAVLSGLLFLPAVFIHFNATALVYAIIYAGLSFVGCFFGNMFGEIG